MEPKLLEKFKPRKSIAKYSVDNFNQKLEYLEMDNRRRETFKAKGIYDVTRMQIHESIDEEINEVTSNTHSSHLDNNAGNAVDKFHKDSSYVSLGGAGSRRNEKHSQSNSSELLAGNLMTSKPLDLDQYGL